MFLTSTFFLSLFQPFRKSRSGVMCKTAISHAQPLNLISNSAPRLGEQETLCIQLLSRSKIITYHSTNKTADLSSAIKQVVNL